jgi:hypothetical protein
MIEIKFVETLRKEVAGRQYVRDSYLVGQYTVNDNFITYSNGTTYRRIDVFETDGFHAASGKSYLPNIYYDDNYFGSFGSGEKRFEIQTTSYGALTTDEFKKFAEAQNHALEVVEALSDKFLK